MKRYSWEEFNIDIATLATILRECGVHERCTYIFGQPRGGLVPAVALSHALNIPIRPLMDRSGCLWVDDIADSGKTLGQTLLSVATLHCCLVQRYTCPYPIIHASKEHSDEWIVFPWEDYAKAEHDYSEYKRREQASV